MATVRLRRLSGSLRHGRLRLPAAVIGAALVAEGAVWLLRPDGVIEPVEVRETRATSRLRSSSARATSGPASAARPRRARGRRRGARVPGRAAAAARLALAERAARGRRLAAGALVGRRPRRRCCGSRRCRSTRSPASARSTSAWRRRAGAAGPGTWSSRPASAPCWPQPGPRCSSGLMRRFPRRWWLGGAVAVVAIEVLFVWLAPVVLAPLFNRYEKLPPGATRSDVTELARRADVDVGEVFVVDASRRTTAANAFVTGLGHTKRVVLYDTLIERFTPGAGAAGGRARARPRQAPRRARAACSGSRSSRRPAMFLVHAADRRAGPRAPARRRATPASPARVRARAWRWSRSAASVVSNQLSRRDRGARPTRSRSS